jgi:glycosyltransferase involved in cell wall biosynthesis
METVNRKPYISVIITAHNRKEFLKEAIQSALNQTLERSNYEILVIKNFKDEEIDRIIEQNGIKNIFTRDESTIGEDLALGIEKSEGDVLCFLDDDDLFLPEKLQTVFNKFKKYDELSYFHNGAYFIDEKGNSIKFWIEELDQDLVFKEIKSLDQLLKLIGYGLFFNMSSISVKKNKIFPYLNELKLISTNPDDFMFFISVYQEPRMFILSREKLTKYRVHQSSSVFIGTDEKDLARNKIEFWYKSIRNIGIIYEIIKKDKFLAPIIDYHIIKNKFFIHLYGERINISIIEIFKYINYVIKERDLKEYIDAFYHISLILLSKIFYEKIVIYYRRRNFMYLKRKYEYYINK